MLAVLPLAPVGPACLSHPDAKSCAAAPDSLTAATNGIYRHVADEVSGVSVVSMEDVVCPLNRCRPVVEGLLVRFDGLHFTADGARWFAQRLESRLPEL